MPTIDGSNVMLGAVLHETSQKVEFDNKLKHWKVKLKVQLQQENTFVLPLILDQKDRIISSSSLNWISDISHINWQYVCFIQDFIQSTSFLNYDLMNSMSRIGNCYSYDNPFVQLIEDFDTYHNITYFETGEKGVIWARDGLLYDLTIPDKEAERLGWGYAEDDGLEVIDMRFVMLFVRFSHPGSTYVEVLFSPFNAVLLKDPRRWGSGYHLQTSDCYNYMSRPADSRFIIRKDNETVKIASGEYCDWYCYPGLYMYPQHASWRQRYGESNMTEVGSSCNIPFDYGMVIGLSVWLYVDRNKTMEEAGYNSSLPRDWNMTIPRMGWWLDMMISRRLEIAIHNVLGPLKNYEVYVLSQFHDQQYAEEWRIYMQSLRGLYERSKEMSITPAVNLHGNLSQYKLPNWMEQTGVFTSNNLQQFGLPESLINSSWFESLNFYQEETLDVEDIDIVALEVVMMVKTDVYDMLRLNDLVRDSIQNLIILSNGSYLSAETLLRDMTVRPIVFEMKKDWNSIYLAVGSFSIAALAIVGLISLAK